MTGDNSVQQQPSEPIKKVIPRKQTLANSDNFQRQPGPPYNGGTSPNLVQRGNQMDSSENVYLSGAKNMGEALKQR